MVCQPDTSRPRPTSVSQEAMAAAPTSMSTAATSLPSTVRMRTAHADSRHVHPDVRHPADDLGGSQASKQRLKQRERRLLLVKVLIASCVLMCLVIAGAYSSAMRHSRYAHDEAADSNRCRGMDVRRPCSAAKEKAGMCEENEVGPKEFQTAYRGRKPLLLLQGAQPTISFLFTTLSWGAAFFAGTGKVTKKT